MEETISKLIKRHKTNCPFTISRGLGIHIQFHDLGTHTRGVYYRKLRRRLIVIHNQLSSEWQRFVCAHELGHDRLHQGMSRFFLEEHSFFNPGKFERQANLFAVKLLTSFDEIQSDETLEQFCSRNGIPEEMHKFY
ncbi:ImmA/IrrE family metallo-endopeptidase [Paenibacillus radicis (ex Xue et al. 2023)]|uniref:ImmA/IrrE family metallo-endopeptidase n=1 Tax=Paenibacillus radicis (ex Xue et al. 2023) TaxID=2972489 RepID=A0ABT1YT44_9BACL|nr:ImmA/IrrE family metallo-endopeptidase [Paenibacillus radicis (ex Xue et al. 2023)]MCR8636177.1 ImmA/IrrE family metallo-endopeptidase [Paenibacillus radicis (ex Xue et al. 2023)]